MDVEHANCKMRISECADLEVIPIARPIKMTYEIPGLEKLVEELHKVFSSDHVNVHEVQELMASYKSDQKHWKKYAKFDRFRYTRNLVDAGNGAFNIMIICWGPGHASAIHDHADSHCFMKVLSGNLEEVRYEWPTAVQPEVVRKLRKINTESCCSGREQNTEHACELDCHGDSCQARAKDTDKDGDENGYDVENMVECSRTRLEVDDVCYINDALGLHRMENPCHVSGAVSLHLYCPPFDSCRVFDERTGKPTKVNVTFWSMYGKKTRVIENNHVADSQ